MEDLRYSTLRLDRKRYKRSAPPVFLPVDLAPAIFSISSGIALFVFRPFDSQLHARRVGGFLVPVYVLGRLGCGMREALCGVRTNADTRVLRPTHVFNSAEIERWMLIPLELGSPRFRLLGLSRFRPSRCMVVIRALCGMLGVWAEARR